MDTRQQFEAYWQERQRCVWGDRDGPVPPDLSRAYKDHHWQAWQAATKAAIEACASHIDAPFLGTGKEFAAAIRARDTEQGGK